MDMRKIPGWWPINNGQVEHTRITSVHQTKDWQEKEDHIYIGMPGYAGQKNGYFGKPWHLLKDPRGWMIAYVFHLAERMAADPVFAGAVVALHGKTLVCFCKGKDKRDDHFCHGDWLATISEAAYHSLEEEWDNDGTE